MNLIELQENKKSKLAKKTLRESYDIDLDLSSFDLSKTQNMLRKVRQLVSETKSDSRIHNSHRDPSYLKLLMMEQALSGHLAELQNAARIIVENEEVQKSQVILAAQDMIDTVQKMIEQISKMNVEELPAVTTGIENEFGSNESQQFNSSASTALQALQEALTTAKNDLSSALGVITGTEAPEMPMDMGAGAEGPEMPTDMGAEPPSPAEPEEPMPPENVGRERR